MSNRIKILGIAPYEGMKTIMTSVAADYPQIDLTLFIGDMEQGLELARNTFHDDYDVIISRGGTAKILQENLSLPVIEIEISLYDILCTLKLADGASSKTALVSFSNCTLNARLLCELMQYDIKICTVESAEEVEPKLNQLIKENYQTVLCDVIANSTAKKLGLNSFLIASGPASIHKAFNQALLLCSSQQRLRNENQFFRQLIQWQIGETIVLNQDGTLVLSTLDYPEHSLLEMLRRELPESQQEEDRRVIRSLNGMLYSIRIRHVSTTGHPCTAFFLDARKALSSPSQTGIRFSSRPEIETEYYNSIFSFAGTLNELQSEINRISQDAAPVMISGEDGTGKESVASLLYMRSSFRNFPFVSINCSLLNEKSFVFLLEHHNSPLADQRNVLYFSNIDALSQERRQQLLAALDEMEVCHRNRVIFSCLCQPDEYMSDVGSQFADKLCCLSLYLPPLRQMTDRIPTLINLSLSHLNTDLSRQIVGAEPEAIALLQSFRWPHNYTQFRRIIGELAVTTPSSIITAEQVRQLLLKEKHIGAFRPQTENAATPLDLNRTMDEINRAIARLVVSETGGNQTAAAKRLGISRTTLWRLLQEK